MLYSKLNQPEPAIVDFGQLLKLNPDHVNALFARAACYNTIGQFSEAIADYNNALLKDQTISREHHHHGHGGGMSGAGSGLSRRPSFAWTQDSSPPTPVVSRSGLGSDLDIPAGAYSSSSREGLETSLAFTPQRHGNPSALAALPPVTIPPPMISSPQTIQVQQQSEMHHLRGYQYRKEGDYEKAIAEYTRALQIDSRNFKAWFNRGFLYDKLGTAPCCPLRVHGV